MMADGSSSSPIQSTITNATTSMDQQQQQQQQQSISQNLPSSIDNTIGQIMSTPSLPSQQQQQQAPQVNSSNVLSQQQQQQQLLQQQQQQSNLMGTANFQIHQQGLQRSPSISRLNHMQQQQQQQQQYNMSANNAARIYGQMNFASGQQQMPQQQQNQQIGQIGNATLTRSGLMGQTGHMTMLPGQAAAAAQLNLQSQLSASPRQKTGLVQGSQFHPGNTPGQSLQGMQMGMNMISPYNLNSQIRANGSLAFSQQRINQGQMRPQLAQQNALASSQAQGLSRTPFMNSQLSALSQNGQLAMMQNNLTQQQWSKQMPAMSAPNSPSYRLQQQRQQQQQQQALLGQQQQQQQQQQQLPSSQMHNSMSLNQQQISQMVQQQQHQQQNQNQQQQPIGHQQNQQQLLQQQSPRIGGSAGQKSLSLTGSQPDATASGTTTPGGSSSQGTEASNHLLGKRKIRDLVAQIDPNIVLDPELEEMLLMLADDFIDSVTSFGAILAKHRNSSIVESKDVLLHLEKNYKLTIPGFSSEEKKQKKDNPPSDLHKKRLDMIQGLMENTCSEANMNNNNNSKESTIPRNQFGGNMQQMRASASSEQLMIQSQNKHLNKQGFDGY
ncbi:transcription initiation factor TFIID subunit 12b isoform X2 [Lactuca sativa]|uniref:Transcription initiation factor TFIID subunit 12 domain-containing protein n=1 Tax=Lactuca sativa TaxID=4236 RepID=A0A9R1WCZ2_LACSA|nr:transcription initiation factor TFIID subunit 12b isoform X2 [Lactuca sativa]KAJ0224467.1 hypothetical protein LSAT_V11C100015870 [Lactuca sativa]